LYNAIKCAVKETCGDQNASNAMEVLKGTNYILIATDHKMFANLSPKKMNLLMNDHPIIVDAHAYMYQFSQLDLDFLH